MKRRVLIVASVVVIAVTLMMWGGPTTVSCKGINGQCVTYKIFSSAPYYEVQYFAHNPFNNRTLYTWGDWQVTTEIPSGKDAYITGYNPMPSGTIKCEIWIGDVLVQQSKYEGGFGLAICDYVVP
jgi:hypothetical protein